MNAIMAGKKMVSKNKNRFFLNQHPDGVQKKTFCVLYLIFCFGAEGEFFALVQREIDLKD